MYDQPPKFPMPLPHLLLSVLIGAILWALIFWALGLFSV